MQKQSNQNLFVKNMNVLLRVASLSQIIIWTKNKKIHIFTSILSIRYVITDFFVYLCFRNVFSRKFVAYFHKFTSWAIIL